MTVTVFAALVPKVKVALEKFRSIGERLDALTLGFAAAVIGVVFIGKKMPVRTLALKEA